MVPEADEEHPSKKATGKQPASGKEAPTLQRIRDLPLDHYREESELPETAHAFYSRAGKHPLLMCLCRYARKRQLTPRM